MKIPWPVIASVILRSRVFWVLVTSGLVAIGVDPETAQQLIQDCVAIGGAVSAGDIAQ